MKVVAVLLVLCALFTVSESVCFVLGELIKAVSGLTAKGHVPDEAEARACIMGQLKDKSKEEYINGCFDECKEAGFSDLKDTAKCIFDKILKQCPEVKPLLGLLKKGK